MSDEQLDELRRAAELHDIGKAAVPDAILDKPGRLEPRRVGVHARHTLVGERILLAAPALATVARWCARATSGGTATATQTG